jgi:hypothetical protein
VFYERGHEGSYRIMRFIICDLYHVQSQERLDRYDMWQAEVRWYMPKITVRLAVGKRQLGK